MKQKHNMEEDDEIFNDIMLDDEDMEEEQERTTLVFSDGNLEEEKLYMNFLSKTKINYKEYTIKKEKIILPDRYSIQKLIGYGSYGCVYAGTDLKTKQKVAIKKINNCFKKSFEFQKRIFRELKLLEFFHHENIVNLVDLIIPPPANNPNNQLNPYMERFHNFNDIYIVQELMESDLRNILNSNQKLTNDHVKFFLYQILKGTLFIHSASVLHRDFKPENILINSDCSIKIADFGLARGIDFEGEFNALLSTPYVATRWYRAPELLLMWSGVTSGIDIWSIGCIFSELLNGKILFPGKNYLHQLDLILNVLGTPKLDDIKACDKAKKYMKSLPIKQPKNFALLFPTGTDPLAIDLLSKMLVFNPLKRINVQDALKHPFFEDLHDPEDEPTSKLFNFQFEKDLKHNKEKINFKRVIFNDIVHFNMKKK